MREPQNGLDAVALFAARAYNVARRYFAITVRAMATTEARMLGTKRRRLVTGAIAVVLILAVVGATVTVNTIDQQNRAAAAVVAQKEADRAEAQATAEAEAEQEAADAAALVEAKASAITDADEAVAKSAEVAAWADPAVLAEVEAARLTLIESGKGSDTGAVSRASFAVRVALDKIGTIEASQDRAYVAARAAAGQLASSAVYGRAYCSKLTTDYPLDTDLVAFRFLMNWSGVGEDLQAISVYCPQYQPVLDSLGSRFLDGKYAVGDASSLYGTSPRTIAAGTYAMGPTQDCYWERSTGAGGIIANDFIGNSVSGFTVSINVGEGFSASGCGTWTKQ